MSSWLKYSTWRWVAVQLSSTEFNWGKDSDDRWTFWEILNSPVGMDGMEISVEATLKRQASWNQQNQWTHWNLVYRCLQHHDSIPLFSSS